jgi:hypothetical protein
MDKDFEKRLDFDSDTFEDMKTDMNFVLQRLIGTMLEKGSTEGSMTIKVDVSMVKEFIPNYDPDIKGESREVNKPQFKHKVTSAVKISDEKSGNLNNEMEVMMDEETGIYVLCPIANTSQRSIFDSDFQQQEGNEPEDESNIIDAEARPLLPGPSDENTEPEEPQADTPEEPTEPTEPGAGLEDITDEFLGNKGADDDYGYDEPEGGEE